MDNSKSKRPRPVLSCLQCRSRKLKCNRSKPCEQCIKASRLEECTFSADAEPFAVPPYSVETEQLTENEGTSQPRKRQRAEASDEASSSRSRKEGGVGVIEDLQLRVKALEERLSIRATYETASNESAPSMTPAAPSKYLGSLAVDDGYRFRYRGQHHRASVLKQFGEIKPFVVQAMRDSRVGSIIKDASDLQKMFARKFNSYCAQPVPDVSSAVLQMIAVLPTKFVSDILVETYFIHWEKILRILHVPTFRREYEAFWRRESEDANLSPGFVPQLLAILIIASRMHSESQALLERGFAYDAYALLKAWQAQLLGKERSYFSNLQACTLLVIAGQILPQPIDKMWTETGALLRHAMTLGLHIEPDEYPRVQIFHGEIRRRLWITILELDIQSSLLSGMPPTIRASDHTTKFPSNYNDSDLTEDMIVLPEPRPLEEWTTTRAHIELARSARARLWAAEICSRQVIEQDDQDEIAGVEKKLLEAIECQPECLILDIGNLPGNRHPDRLTSLMLLSLFSRRALISLYRPVVFNGGWDTRIHIRTKFFDSALAFLEFQEALDPESRQTDSLNTNTCWGLLQNLCKHDMVQAALSLCFEIRCMNESLQDPVESRPSLLERYNTSDISITQPSTSKNKASLIRLVKTTLHLLVRGIAHHGIDIKDILMVAAVSESVRSNAPQVDKYTSMMEEVIRVIGLCRPHFQKEQASVKPREGGYPLQMRNIPSVPPSTSPATNGDSVNVDTVPSADISMEDLLNFDDFDFGFPDDWQLNGY